MVEEVTVAGAPDIPGLRFRRFDHPGDYQNIIDIFTASSDTDDLEYSETKEEVQKYYSNLANCEVDRDMIFVEVDGKAIGYSRVWHIVRGDRPGAIYQFFCALVPEWRGKGIRKVMLEWCESRVRERRGADFPDAECEIILWVGEKETDMRGLLDGARYEIVRYGFRMVRPNLDNIPDCPLPPGLEVRPVKPEHYRKIWDADVEASKDGWLNLKAEEEWFQNWMSSRLFQPELWQVAWDGDRVAGMVQNFIDDLANEQFGRKWGWTENIHVGREWRGKGVAKALIARSFQILKDKGMEQAALGVDAMNPTGALHLYKRMGFVENKRSFTYLKKV